MSEKQILYDSRAGGFELISAVQNDLTGNQRPSPEVVGL